MAYSESLAYRIRLALAHLPRLEEKAMMGGLTFMVDGKMCVGIIGDELMCRIDPNLEEIVLEKPGCRPMDFTGRPMKGYVMVDGHAMHSEKEFNDWINLCLDFNPRAKASKKKK